ncbi:MAG: hypothetical protein HKN76_17575, partial [Saprospiraceae bacterium]|nr:hypothetical protein [Saprospiraceae bacterium]
MKYILDFEQIDLSSIDKVGGKNASLGELIRHLKPLGIGIPGGFATTASAYWDFLDKNKIKEKLHA